MQQERETEVEVQCAVGWGVGGVEEEGGLALPLKRRRGVGGVGVGGGRLNCLQRQRPLLSVCDPLHTHTPPKFLASPFQPPLPSPLSAGWVDFDQHGCHIPADGGVGGGGV